MTACRWVDTSLSMLLIRFSSHSELILMLMNPGPARVGFPARSRDCGRFCRINSPTARGFFGAPSCKHLWNERKLAMTVCIAGIG